MAARSRQLATCRSIAEFFHGEVDQAFREQKLLTSQEVEVYLVNLLSAFSMADPADLRLDEPLALMLNRAVTTSHSHQVVAFRRLGDVSLFVAGLFSASLKRRLVDIDYAISMGSSAYAAVATLIKNRSARPAEVIVHLYVEMSEKFPWLVEVLMQIGERTTLGADSPDLAELYERWRRTNGPHLMERMRALGVWPTRG